MHYFELISKYKKKTSDDCKNIWSAILAYNEFFYSVNMNAFFFNIRYSITVEETYIIVIK